MSELTANHKLDISVAKALGYVRVPVATAKRNPPGVEGFVFTVAYDVPAIDNGVYVRHVNDGDFARFAPSTDIAAAFQVVDKLLDGTRTFSLECWSVNNDSWQAMFKCEFDNDVPEWGRLDTGWARTRPLAICHAALKVIAEETAGVQATNEPLTGYTNC